MFNWVLGSLLLVCVVLATVLFVHSPDRATLVAPKRIVTVDGCSMWRVYDEQHHKFVYLNQCGNVVDEGRE